MIVCNLVTLHPQINCQKEEYGAFTIPNYHIFGMWTNCPHPYTTMLCKDFVNRHFICDPDPSGWARFPIQVIQVN